MGNQKPYIEGQTTQWPQDTKGVIRIVYRRTDNTMATRYQRGNQNPYIEQNTPVKFGSNGACCFGED